MLNKIRFREYDTADVVKDKFWLVFDSVTIDYNFDELEETIYGRMDALLFAVVRHEKLGGIDHYEINYIDLLEYHENFNDSDGKIHPTLEKIPDGKFRKFNEVVIEFNFEETISNLEVYIMYEIVKKLESFGFKCEIEGVYSIKATKKVK